MVHVKITERMSQEEGNYINEKIASIWENLFFYKLTEESVRQSSKKILFITSPSESLHAHDFSKPFRVLISKIDISKLTDGDRYRAVLFKF